MSAYGSGQASAIPPSIMAMPARATPVPAVRRAACVSSVREARVDAQTAQQDRASCEREYHGQAFQHPSEGTGPTRMRGAIGQVAQRYEHREGRDPQMQEQAAGLGRFQRWLAGGSPAQA